MQPPCSRRPWRRATSPARASSTPLAELGQVDVGGLFGAHHLRQAGQPEPVPAQTTIFKVNPKVPGALEAVKKMFTTPAAEAYSFKKA